MIKKIVILKPKKSLNFSESCNAGIKHSKNYKIFIANDDIIISKNTVEKLFENTDDTTITGPDSNCNLGFQTDYAYTVKGTPLVPAMLLNQVKHILPDIYNLKVIRNDIIGREWLAFFAVMFTRKCFDDVGIMDETFIYDKEDLDWCVRAKSVGKKFRQIFSSYCFHFGGVSRKRKHQELGLKHDLDQEHNQLYYFQKYQIKDKPLLGFDCWDAWEYWDENSLNTPVSNNKPAGIGGSETQAILLTRELAKLGYKVKLFNKCKENHMDSSGVDVEYIPFQDFEKYSKNIKYNYFIASRYLHCFNVPFKYDRAFGMIHDVHFIMDQKDCKNVRKDKIEKYFCLSNAHKEYVSGHHGIPMDQILITSNGLDFSRFENKNIKKDPYKMIYSSSPDRGLETLLVSLFPKIKKEIPEVTLDIFYGFENFNDKAYVEKMLKIIKETPGVTYHGRVGQDRLAEAFLKSNIWSYSSNFEETFCITALEAMASETICLTSKWWGLADTIKEGGILLEMHNNRNTLYTKEYQDKWVEECIKLLKDPEYAESWRRKGKERVQRFTWSAVARQWANLFENGIWKEIQ